MADAIASAVLDVESVGLRAIRVMDQDLLSLADIADRIGQSRESVRRYATGARGPGGFPHRSTRATGSCSTDGVRWRPGCATGSVSTFPTRIPRWSWPA
jgi:hypothetical protein